MKRIVVAAALVFMVFLGYEVAESVDDQITLLSGGTSAVGKLTGKTVKNIQGEDLGPISDLVKGPEGRIAFAIISFRAGNNARKKIAVPIGALSCGEQTCVLNASRETVGTTPPFVSMDDLAKTRTAGNIYIYFGLQPYWTDEATQGKK